MNNREKREAAKQKLLETVTRVVFKDKEKMRADTSTGRLELSYILVFSVLGQDPGKEFYYKPVAKNEDEDVVIEDATDDFAYNAYSFKGDPVWENLSKLSNEDMETLGFEPYAEAESN